MDRSTDTATHGVTRTTIRAELVEQATAERVLRHGATGRHGGGFLNHTDLRALVTLLDRLRAIERAARAWSDEAHVEGTETPAGDALLDLLNDTAPGGV